ncbi:hypothetical protein DL93DRAFT_2170093 [Clavulina sp. PMI_390]|nr:hypothetical protein DL93DRAFT_2170093 [Clavulina sp. PMI_390]
MFSPASAFRLTRSLPLLALSLASVTFAGPMTLSPPDQPTQTGQPLTFSIKGNTGVTAQQPFLGADVIPSLLPMRRRRPKILRLCRRQDIWNPMTVGGYPASSEVTLITEHTRALDVKTNACANRTTLVMVEQSALEVIRLVTDDESDDAPANSPRLVEIRTRIMMAVSHLNLLSLAFLLSSVQLLEPQNKPTYEFFPSVGSTLFSQLLNQTLPANLYPLTWLLPSGKLFIQANWQAELLDLSANKETFLGDIPHLGRYRPLAFDPENDYETTVLFCGGSNIAVDAWNPATNVIIDIPADSTIFSDLLSTVLSSTTRRTAPSLLSDWVTPPSTAFTTPLRCCSLTAPSLSLARTLTLTTPSTRRLSSQLSYGGAYFDVTLSSDDMGADATTNAPQTKARYLELNSTYTVNLDGTVTLHVSQLPANANLFLPGPAAIHIVVAGVPSVGKMIMLGSGKIETQALLAVTPLPPRGVQANNMQTNSTGDGGNGDGPSVHASSALGLGASATFALALLLVVAGLSFTV